MNALGRAGVVFGVGVLINYPWELAQAPLYRGMDEPGVVLWHCFRAALGDGVLVLIILSTGGPILRQRDWFLRPGTRGYLVMLLVGLILGVSVEWVAVHNVGRWAYTPLMPVIPGLEIGVVPVAQMLLLPPLIFHVAARLSRRVWPSA